MSPKCRATVQEVAEIITVTAWRAIALLLDDQVRSSRLYTVHINTNSHIGWKSGIALTPKLKFSLVDGAQYQEVRGHHGYDDCVACSRFSRYFQS